MSRQGGGDENFAGRPSGPGAFFEAFRRRSKSDSKSGRRPAIINVLRNSIPWTDRGNSRTGGRHHGAHPVVPCIPGVNASKLDPNPYYTYGYQNEYRTRNRSGSGSPGSNTAAKFYDIFRNRSQSVSVPTELRAHRVSVQCSLIVCAIVPFSILDLSSFRTHTCIVQHT